MLKGLRAIFDKRLTPQSPYEFLPSSETIERLQMAQRPPRASSLDVQQVPTVAQPTSVGALPSPVPQPISVQKKEIVPPVAVEIKRDEEKGVELTRTPHADASSNDRDWRALECRALQAQVTRNAIFVTPRLVVSKEDLDEAIDLVERHITRLREGSFGCMRTPERKIQAFVELLVRLRKPEVYDFSVADIVRRWERGSIATRAAREVSVLDLHRNRLFSEIRPTVSTESRRFADSLKQRFEREDTAVRQVRPS